MLQQIYNCTNSRYNAIKLIDIAQCALQWRIYFTVFGFYVNSIVNIN
jgi:hypothetical protein